MNFLTPRLCRVAASVVLAGSTAACATVTRGTTEAWTVQSEPPGAAVKTSVGMNCDATPCTFKIKRKAEFDVTVTKPGYKVVHTRVLHQVANAGAAGMAGNVLVGGIIGAGVDIATGAMMELKPNPLVIKLEADDPASTPVAPPAAS